MKKALLISVVGALVAGVLGAAPAGATHPISTDPEIVDQPGDANHHSWATGQAHTGSLRAADILQVWFGHDADFLYVHFQTHGAVQLDSHLYEVLVDPGSGEACLYLMGVSPGANNDARVAVDARDCGGEFAWVDEGGEFLQEEGPDTTGLHTIKLPRSSSEAFADGNVLKTPSAFTRFHIQTPQGSAFPSTIDSTDIGRDYTIGGGEPPPVDEPPVVDEPEEPKKLTKADCKKIKNKKKKKRCLKKLNAQNQEPPAEECPAYEPGEQGAEAETVVVTDEHTEEAPLEITIEQGPGLGGPLIAGVPPDQTSRAYKNVQVDTEGAEAGLYIRYEFPIFEDHDLFVNYPDGSEAAHVAGFNATPVPAFGIDGTGNGGHSEQGAEQLDGLRTADCAGYTVDFSNFLGEGGEYTVKLWSGEIQNDPAAPAEDGGAGAALEMMQETLK